MFASLLPAPVATLPMAIAAPIIAAMPKDVAPRTVDRTSYAAATPKRMVMKAAFAGTRCS
jgi:hypothetical protein